MWSGSCVIWRNSDPTCAQYKQTLALCSEISPKILMQLSRLSLCDTNYFGTISNNSLYEHVWKASRWLLCSLARAQPELLDQLLDIYGFDESPIPENLIVLDALSHICQSKPAIDRLLNSCSLEIWIQKAVQICEQDQKEEEDLRQLQAIVKCIEELTLMTDVCKLLEQSEYGPAFFRNIMNFLVTATKNSERISTLPQGERKYFHDDVINTVANEVIPIIRSSFINLTRRCLTFGDKHRARIAKYLCKILRDKNEHQQNNYFQPKPLNDFILQILHRLILDDEIIKVHFTDVVEQLPDGVVLHNKILPIHESHRRLVHPIFGCLSDDCVINCGLYTKCSELVPSSHPSDVDTIEDTTTYAAKVSSKKNSSTVKPPLKNTKYSAADHWLKYHGFVPPPSFSSAAPISVDGLQQQSIFQQQAMQQQEPPPDWDWDMEDDWSDDFNSSAPWTPPGPLSHSSSINAVHVALPKFASKSASTSISSAQVDTTEQRKIQLIDANTQLPFDEETTLGELFEQRKNSTGDNAESEDGEHMMLCLSMRYVPETPTSSKKRVSQKTSKIVKKLETKEKPSVPISTLEHFAREGGLVELSKHIYLYRRCLTRLHSCQERLSSDLIERQQRASSNNNNVSASISTASTAQGVPQIVQTLSVPPGFNPSTFIPFEFVDFMDQLPSNFVPPPPSTGLYSNVLGNIPMGQLFNNNEWPPLQPVGLGSNPHSHVLGNVDTGKMPSRQPSMLNSPPVDQFFHNSAHVIVLLGLFLRLEQYGELLIEMDRGKTKQLLRMVLDIHSPITSSSSRVAFLRPRTGNDDSKNNIKSCSITHKNLQQQKNPSFYNYHYYTQKPPTSSSMIKTSTATSLPAKPSQNYQRLGRYVSHEHQAHQEELLLFPFVVLARLFNDFDPADVGIERAQALRDKALKMGIVDVLLTSLAHFSRQPNRLEPLHPVIAEEQPMVELISYVLNAAFRMERLFQLAGTLQQQTMDLQLMIANGGGPTDYIINPTVNSNISNNLTTAIPTTTLSSATIDSTAKSLVTIPSMMTQSSASFATAENTEHPLVITLSDGIELPGPPEIKEVSSAVKTSVNLETTTIAGQISSSNVPPNNAMPASNIANTGSITLTSASLPQQTATTTQTQNDGGYWAKGTGFGSGTTQQQWSLSQHVAKRRQDENNVAALLHILIAFISPHSQRLQEKQSINSNKKDKETTNFGDGIELALPIEELTTSTKSQNEIKKTNETDELVEVDKIGKGGEFPSINLSEEFVELLFRSCLFSTLNSYLMNDSVLDISKRVHAFESVISLVDTIANALPIPLSNLSKFPNAAILDKQGNQDIFDIIFLSGEKQIQKQISHKKKLQQVAAAESELLERLDKLGKNIEIYLSKLQTGHRVNATSGESPLQRNTKRKAWRKTTAANSSKSQADLEEEEELGKLLYLVQSVCSAINKKKRIHSSIEMDVDDQEHNIEEHLNDNIELAQNVASSSNVLLKASDAAERFYCDKLRGLQFETIPFFESMGNNNNTTPIMCIPFHYVTSLNSVGSAGGSALGKRTRRLAQEIVSLSSSLPLSISSSVFVRTCEERLDAMKVLITGPSDTPYANGCFEFDVFFPPDYPNVPMQMNLETTGNRTVRFNPNLYDDGKVCLSILNTWRGRPEERWNADTSSLLQVLVSIQSLILVNEPYFNEPGYERWRNSPAGQQASREYDANIMQMCVRWAMVEQIRNPPKAFTEIVRSHFWMKRDEICDQVEAWIEDIQNYITTHASSGKVLPSYLAGLKKHFETLKMEFKKMTAPLGLENCKSKRFEIEKDGT
ncbi:hypothetical protein ACQ4LE_003795 [Meloidogyne hapla]